MKTEVQCHPVLEEVSVCSKRGCRVSARRHGQLMKPVWQRYFHGSTPTVCLPSGLILEALLESLMK